MFSHYSLRIRTLWFLLFAAGLMFVGIPNQAATIAQWSINQAEGDTLFDLSNNHNNLIISGAEWSNGELVFDGIDDYASSISIGELNIESSKLTLEIICKTTSSNSGGHKRILGKGDQSGALGGFSIGFNTNNITPGALCFQSGGVENTVLYGSNEIDDGEWHHIAGVISEDSMYLYIDYLLDSAIALSTPDFFSNGIFGIGGADNNNTGTIWDYFWSGSIEAVRISDTDLRVDNFLPLVSPAYEWIVYAEPILTPGPIGDWDDTLVRRTCIIEIPTGYRMYYTGAHPGVNSIGMAESGDGIHWLKYNDPATPNSPYAQSDPIIEDSSESPFVLFDNTDPIYPFKMWYLHGYYEVYHLQSVDGIHWEQGDWTNPLSLESPSGWDNNAILGISIIQEDGLYKLWYSANPSPGANHCIGYASSVDGINWETPSLGLIEFEGDTDNNIVLQGSTSSWDNRMVTAPHVLKNGNPGYRMWYTGRRQDPAPSEDSFGIAAATSLDGIIWQRVDLDAPILAQGNTSWDFQNIDFARVVPDGDLLYFSASMNGVEQIGVACAHPILESDDSILMGSTSSITASIISVPIEVSLDLNRTNRAAELNFSGFQAGLDFLGIDTTGTLIGGLDWTWAENECDGFLQTAFAGTDGITGEGVFCYLEFLVTGDVCSTIPVNCDYAMFGTTEVTDITNGSVYIEPLPFYGDVDLDGEVHAQDAADILLYVIDSLDLDCQAWVNADVDLSDTVDAMDASYILQFVVDSIDSLPIASDQPDFLARGELVFPDVVQADFGQPVEIPIILHNGENILAQDAIITFEPAVLKPSENNFIQFSNVSGFNPMYRVEGNTIKMATASGTSNTVDGLFATLKFDIISEDTTTTVITFEYFGLNSNLEIEPISVIVDIITSTAEESLIPGQYALHHNYPNPFNPMTTIRYGLPETAEVSLVIFDMKGREVNRLVQTRQAAGWHALQWNGTNAQGRQVSTGVYIARISAGSFTDAIKMVYLR